MMGPQRIDFQEQDPTSSTTESRPHANIFRKEEIRMVAPLRYCLSQAAPRYPPMSMSFSPSHSVSLFCPLEIHCETSLNSLPEQITMFRTSLSSRPPGTIFMFPEEALHLCTEPASMQEPQREGFEMGSLIYWKQ